MYDKLKNSRVRCRTCCHFCVLTPGHRGQCGGRENQDGQLMVLKDQLTC